MSPLTKEQFRSLTTCEGLEPSLRALWYDARGAWEEAHELAQRAGGKRGDWVHAYLHRKEGDLGNAGYWYRRAGREMPGADVTLLDEWERIVSALLLEEGSRKRIEDRG